ncbi:MAG TPA: hypothetical protein P5328_01550 [Candidatus Paceibacterota bacterium]|nr:hypothetical protein [Candidatus Paceibacterota bacterium]HRZ34680.1 hypothetical protein [Candidatus Paceibacterota bacterium]
MTQDFLIIVASGFFLLSLLGFFLAYLYGRRTTKFYWREYFALIIIPIISTIYLTKYFGPKLLTFYVISSLIGFILEYGLGLAYHKAINYKLWRYHKDEFSISGYTSLLTIPIWGIGGVVFFLISKAVGL